MPSESHDPGSAPGSAPGARQGTEPDYRFTLANERTFLAWVRTSLALLAGGVAITELVPALGPRPERLALGLTLIGLALLIATTSHRRWQKVDDAIRVGDPLPPSRLPAALAIGLSLVIGVIVVLLIRA